VRPRLKAGADSSVNQPPGNLGIGALLLRRVDVDAAEQGCFRIVEQRVVKGLMGRDLCFVPGQVLDVLLVRHRGGRPAPCRAEDRPQAWLRAHHGRVIEISICGLDRPQMIAIANRHPRWGG
jgi:hypothetical protein